MTDQPRQLRNRLEFSGERADNPTITLAPPVGESHRGQVAFLNNARFELHCVTATPPLRILNFHAELGWLLFWDGMRIRLRECHEFRTRLSKMSFAGFTHVN